MVTVAVFNIPCLKYLIDNNPIGLLIKNSGLSSSRQQFICIMDFLYICVCVVSVCVCLSECVCSAWACVTMYTTKKVYESV